ncbi:ABC transporter permease [Tengunoibacter tsumagoiensis]|uniref:Transport permease protein n=1 Tax=Tengunoibacter tsumagoiensis TaxID=2014871 RepID=A0A401ZXS0_9CHLR|nr:ABC transporter permease [Tengunoibacter tsumagoiensis]GCE11632.1 transport permease protein [Tengunoibacter tsumagoiensis]
MATQLPSLTTTNQPASPFKQVLNQVRYELLLTARRGENLAITFIVPIVLLVFFTSLNFIPNPAGTTTVERLLPGILAMAIIAAGMVNLGIATAYERYYGVLKRLGSSPLSRSGLISAKIITILLIEVVQFLVLVGVAALYGWRPVGSPFLTLLALVLGTITFSALGLAMAGGLRAEATLAGANILYLIFLFIGGVIAPLDLLPAPLKAFSHILPSTALIQTLQTTMSRNSSFPGSDLGSNLLVLGIWAILALVIAIRTFKWE